MEARSLYMELAVPAPESAEPGETIETKARETVDNDCEALFLDVVVDAAHRPTLYGEIGRRADSTEMAGGTSMTAAIESYDEDGLAAESISACL